MPRFRYSAYTATGALEKGELQAASDLAALDQLSTKGLKPVSLELGGHALPWWQREFSLSGKSEANPRALLQLFKTLAGLLGVQFSLVRAIQFCQENSQDPAMSRALERVQADVSDGSSLAEAMRQADGYFPDRLVSMIEIGEASDRLAFVTKRIAQTLAQETDQRREIRSAMIYPMILIVMSLLVMALLVFFLAPTLTPVFASADTEPPAILKFMNGLRHLILTQWPSLGIGLMVVIGLWQVFKSKAKGLINHVFFRLPVIGDYLRQSETLKVMQTLLLMLSSGAPLNLALQTVANSTRSPRYRDLFVSAHDQVVAGAKLSQILAGSTLIDPMAVAMLQAGEESDQMTPVLEEIVGDLHSRTSATLSKAVKLITPLFTLLIGLTVGAVILSTISAIMSLNDVAF